MRKGDWIRTATGGQFWPLDPRPDEVNIEDIAHALSHQCRFAGHVKEFYSVAQHSVMVSVAAVGGADRVRVAKWGLLHDAAEAYLVDVPTPVKRYLSEYKEAEERLQDAIAEAFGLTGKIPDAVHYADRVVLATEMRDLMPVADNTELPPPLVAKVVGMSPIAAKTQFMTRFRQLFG